MQAMLKLKKMVEKTTILQRTAMETLVEKTTILQEMMMETLVDKTRIRKMLPTLVDKMVMLLEKIKQKNKILSLLI